MFEKIIIDILIILTSIFILLFILAIIQLMIALRNINRAANKIKTFTESLDVNYGKILKFIYKLIKV
jgi:hypothetical protein